MASHQCIRSKDTGASIKVPNSCVPYLLQRVCWSFDACTFQSTEVGNLESISYFHLRDKVGMTSVNLLVSERTLGSWVWLECLIALFPLILLCRLFSPLSQFPPIGLTSNFSAQLGTREPLKTTLRVINFRAESGAGNVYAPSSTSCWFSPTSVLPATAFVSIMRKT